MGVLRRIVAWLAFGRQVRIETYRLAADLIEARFDLERVLDVAVTVAGDQGQWLRKRILLRWRQALVENRFVEELRLWVPASEAMIFSAYGRVDAGVLFSAAARIASMRDRQIAAVVKAVTQPGLVAVTMLALLWGAGGWLVPSLEQTVPADRWLGLAGIFRAVSLWLYEDAAVLGLVLAGAAAALTAVTVGWTGPGRTLLDRVAPFSLYRLIVGSAFLFVAIEFLRAGQDLNEEAFARFRRSSSRYGRHRIGAIQTLMARGWGLGTAMVQARHGFPDPALAPVAAALDGTEGWEAKLGAFVERWVERSEDMLRARTAVLNAGLLAVAAAVGAGALLALFGVMQEAARMGGL